MHWSHHSAFFHLWGSPFLIEMLHFSISGILRLSAHWENLFYHLLDPSFVSSLRVSIFPSLGSFVCQLTERLYFYLSDPPFVRSHWEAPFFHLWDPPFVSSLKGSIFPSLRSSVFSSLRESIFQSLGSSVFQVTKRLHFIIPPLSGVTERLYFPSLESSVCQVT
jgi:hypothetical protein